MPLNNATPLRISMLCEAPNHCKVLFCTSVPLCLYAFILLHLCPIAPWHCCTIALHQLTNNYLHIYIILQCIFIGYIYTHWNYTRLSIKSHLIVEIFLLIHSFVLYINCSSDPIYRSPPLTTLVSSSAPLYAYFTLDKVRSFQKDQLCLLAFYFYFTMYLFNDNQGQLFVAHSCFYTS